MSITKSNIVTPAPVFMKLKPDTVLPTGEQFSRDGVVSELTQELQNVFAGIPKPSGLAIVEPSGENGSAKQRVLATRRITIEVQDFDHCSTELKSAIVPTVFSAMKATLRVFGMTPKSINIVEL